MSLVSSAQPPALGAVMVRSQRTSAIQTEDKSLLDAVASLGKQRGTLLYKLQERGAGHIDGWPGWARESVLATRPLKDKERFAVVLFFLGNGVLPCAIAAYFASSGATC